MMNPNNNLNNNNKMPNNDKHEKGEVPLVAPAVTVIRSATLNDIPHLVSLEERFWIQELRASQVEIEKRVETFPEGQLVLVGDDGKTLLGVLYTLRLRDIATAHAPNGFQRIEDAFDPKGPVWQLMAIAVDTTLVPTGANLLRAAIYEKALKGASSDGVKRLIAVTRCSKSNSESEKEYVAYALSGQDPTLFFHISGGAKIVNLIKGYRQADVINFGYGVLVEYNLTSFLNRKDEKEATTKEDHRRRHPSLPHQSIASTEHQENHNTPDLDVKAICKELWTLCRASDDVPAAEKSIIINEAWSTKPFLQILDSLQLQQLHHWLQVKTAKTLPPEFLFEFSNAQKVAEYFSSSPLPASNTCTAVASSMAGKNLSISKDDVEPVAIVGIGMRLPCGIHSLDRLWECMASKTSCSSKVPTTRWYANDGIKDMFGCFVEKEDWFDPTLFGLNDSETEQMDPHHRLLLECVARAVYDSGKRLPDLAEKNIGVWVGASTNDFPEIPGFGYKGNDSTYAATSCALSMAAGRISYLLGLHGPSMTIDTACSSSLVAIDQACSSLRNGNCDQAIVAAVNLILAPWISNAYSRAGMLSPTGECKSFDANANGYCRGEGAGALLLKPLSKAIAAGDSVYGLIRSSAVMHHGKGASLTAPNSKVQEALLRSSLSKAGLLASDIAVLEAHGTGTKLGDPIEVAAIARVFGADNALIINCVKANIGHLEAAAGIAGVFASLACMKYGQVPGQAHLHTLNENIEKAKQSSKLIFPTDSLKVNNEQQQLHDGALFWSINSFGYSGTIANIILEHRSKVSSPRKMQLVVDYKQQLGHEEEASFHNDYKPRRFLYGPKNLSIITQDHRRSISSLLSAADAALSIGVDDDHELLIKSKQSVAAIQSPPPQFNDSIINEINFTCHYGEDVLSDHVVHGELVLAGACMIDIVCARFLLSVEKAKLMSGSGGIILSRISVTRKVIYDSSNPATGKLVCRQGAVRNNDYSIELLIMDPIRNGHNMEMFSPEEKASAAMIACFACKSVTFLSRANKLLPADVPNITATSNNSDAVLSSSTTISDYYDNKSSNGSLVTTKAPKELYDSFANRGLHFGQTFRLIKQDILIRSNSAMSVISTTAVVDKKNDGILQMVNDDENLFIASPQLIDALFQLCGFILFTTRGENYPNLLVPFSIDQVTVYTLLADDANKMITDEGAMKLELKVTVRSQTKGGALFDGRVMLPNGVVFVSLTNVMLRSMAPPQTPAASFIATAEKKEVNMSMINIASSRMVVLPTESAFAERRANNKVEGKPLLFQVLTFGNSVLQQRPETNSLQSTLSKAFASFQALYHANSSVNTEDNECVKILIMPSVPLFSTSDGDEATSQPLVSDFINYIRTSIISSKARNGVIMLAINKATEKQSLSSSSSSAAVLFAALQCVKMECDLSFAKLFEISSDILEDTLLIASQLKIFAQNDEVYYRLYSMSSTKGQVMRLQPELSFPPKNAFSELRLAGRGSLSKLNLILITPPAVSHFNNQQQWSLLNDDEIEIQVIGNSLNFRDVLNVLGMYPGDPGDPGCEFSGVVLTVGARVTKFVVGDAVIGLKTGCLRSRIIIQQSKAVKAPSTIPLAIASVLPVVYTTVEKAFHSLSPSDVVLIHTAAGGVGFAAVQYAKRIGAVIIATASKGKHSILREEEKIEHICDSRDATAFRKEIKDVIGITGMVTVVLNTLNGDYIDASLEVLAPCGRFVELGKRGIMTIEEAREKRSDIFYEVIAIDDMAESQPVEYIKLLDEVARKFDFGFWPIPRCQLFVFTQFKQAFELLRSGKSLGKVVLYHTVSEALATLPINCGSLPPLSSQPNEKLLLSAVVITGGTGSLGVLTIKALLSMNYADKIFVLSRNACSKRADILQALPSNCNNNIHFLDCDVSNKSQIVIALATIRRTGHSIEGIIHAAGVIRDGLIINGNAEKGFAEVWSSKVQAALNLSESTLEDNLKVFIMYSSIVGLIGRYGQSAYAAANCALDQLAEERHHRNLPATSIRWPAIANTGMAASTVVDHRGWSIQDADFTASLMIILKSSNFAMLPVITMFPSNITSTLDISRASLFASCACDEQRVIKPKNEYRNAEEGKSEILQNRFTVVKTDDEVEEKQLSFVLPLLNESISNNCLPSLLSQEELIETIRGVVKKYTSSPLHPTQNETSLTDLGVDSLAATELANDLGKVFDLLLSPTLVFSYPTVQEIVAKIQLELQQKQSLSHTVEGELKQHHNRQLVKGEQMQHERQPKQGGKKEMRFDDDDDDDQELVNDELIQQHQPSSPSPTVKKYCTIVGMACRFPGGIKNLEQLSNAMYSKQILVGKAPVNRGFEATLNKLEYLKKRKSQVETVQHGGFLDDTSLNDLSFTDLLNNNGNIMTDLELQRMDLRQKLALKMAIEAITDAGIDPHSMQGRNVGVFVGSLGHLHTNVPYLTASTNNIMTTTTEKPSVFDATSNSHSVISGRISFLLGLEGPSMTIDTACSSSLVALHTARRALEANDCEMALVIGVNVIELDLSLAFATAGMLSPDGQCHTFDEAANGYCRGEGCGALLLTRQSSTFSSAMVIKQAYAVIKGSAVMQDGKSANLTAPNGLAQERLLRGTLYDAGLVPEDIQIIEAHGTGTKLGDPIEIESIRNVYLKSPPLTSAVVPRAKNNPLYITSVKANLGHMEAAAGMAGLFAIVASLRKQRVYPNAALHKLNPHIDSILNSANYELGNVIFPQTAASLFKPVLHAAVSSFGYSGTIANVILGSVGSEFYFTANKSLRDEHGLTNVSSDSMLRRVVPAEKPTLASSLKIEPTTNRSNEILAAEAPSKHLNSDLYIASSAAEVVVIVDDDEEKNQQQHHHEKLIHEREESPSSAVIAAKPKDYHDKIKTIKAIIKTVIVGNSAFEEIDEASNLVDLGLLDSLTATELSNQLTDEFDLNMSLSVGIILDTPTIHGIVSAVLEALHEIEKVFAAAIAEQSTLAKNVFSNNPWFLNYFVPEGDVEVLGRLLVFGGMAHPAASWNAFVQPLVIMGFHVHIVRFPGRFERFGEPAATDVQTAIGGLCSTLNDLGWLTDALPLAVMGYSFGATMAYETARLLEHDEKYRDKCKVCQLILLAGPDRTMLANWEFPALEDRTLASFVNYHVKHMGRMNPHFDADAAYLPTLLGFILEVFFRDIQLSQAWMAHYDQLTNEERQVTCSLLCVNGAQDMAVKQTNSWLDIVTTGKYEQISFPGDHFFVYQDAKLDTEVAVQMGKAIKRSLGKW